MIIFKLIILILTRSVLLQMTLEFGTKKIYYKLFHVNPFSLKPSRQICSTTIPCWFKQIK